MRYLRRFIHVLAWLGTLAVALLCLVLIASQTPWFRDYLRRVIVREAKQYLDGELTIGRLGGNLFFGVTLSDVAVDVSGSRVIAIKGLEIDYSVFQLISRGIVLDRIALTSPYVRMTRDERGWNLSRLVKKREQEADRKGPGRPISLPSIAITGGVVEVDDRVGSTTYRIPRRIDGLEIEAGFEYAPVHYSVKLGKLSFRATEPGLIMQQLAGNFAVRDDNVYLDAMRLKTGETDLGIDGVIESYLRRPVIKVVADGRASLPEIGRILLAVAGYDLHPDLRVRTAGTLDALRMDLDVKSEAGLLRGPITADFQTPDLRFSGPAHVERLNLGPVFRNPKQRTDITGDAKFDVAILSAPAGAPALDRLRGTFAFRGPRVHAFDYQAANVDAAGSIQGPRVELTRARAAAYGAVATTSGHIVLPQGKRKIAYDLRGTAERVDMRRLPAFLRAPRLETDVTLSEYHVQGSGSAATGTATMRQSQVEGATIAEGTLLGFDVGPGRLAYSARGAATDLDLPRLGRALDVQALVDPLYEGRVNGAFDVRGSGTTIEKMTLDASGTLRKTIVGGTTLPELTFAARIADRALSVQAKGGFEHLNPGVLAKREALDGNVSGIVDATLRIPDLSAPFTTSGLGVEGAVTLAPSLVGGVQIAGANIVGKYESDVADLTRLQIKGPDVMLDANGRLALDRRSQSNLTYHVDAGNLTEVGRVAGQTGVEGSVLIDGTITGNAANLQTSGSLRGIGLTWNEQRLLGTRATFSVAVPDLDFVNARVEATTEAEFVQLTGIELNRVTARTIYAQKRLDFTTRFHEQTREIETSGNVVFHPDHQEIHLPQFAVRTNGVEWRMAPGGDPAIQYRTGEMEIKNVVLTSADQSVAVDGTLSLGSESRQASGKLTVQARNVDLAQAERLLLMDRGLGGRLTADAIVGGTASQPIVDGHVEVIDGRFQNYAYQSLVADVDYGDRRITLDATLQQAPGVSITAKGIVPTTAFAEDGGGRHIEATPNDRFDLHIQTPALNLGLIQGFTTVVTNVAGSVQADVHITGAGRDPHFGGFIEIRDGAFAVPRVGTSYSGLDTRIDLEPDSLRIRRFEILDENGEQMAVAGRLAVHARQVGAVDVTLESQDFEAIDNELGDVGIGSRLKITGELTRPKLEGELRVTAGRLEVDRILQLFYDPYRTDVLPQVVSAERAAQAAGGAEEATRQALGQAAQGAKPSEQTPPPFDEDFYFPPPRSTFFENVALYMRVRIPDNLVLRGRKLRPGGPTRATIGDINITVGGDLTVRKNYDEPLTIAGTVNTVRGTYQFQGRQFEIARDGTLRFTGEPSNPIVDVTAVRRIPNTGVEARVHITGSVQQPELQLSSTPPLEESDVLALIVFNRPISELGTGERASLATTAGGIATGFIADPLGQSIGRALDLDLFEITTSSDGDTLGAGVTVGKQIGERTFFKLRQQFGERTYSEFLLEYQIADFLRLAASGAPETSGAANRIGQRRLERAGIDLIFFFSY
jgi:autotransporter translocation and assembly factor TamB